MRIASQCAVCAAVFSIAAHAQDYPNKRVSIIVPYTAGGGVDTVTRVLAQKMAESTGQAFIVDNRPGAGGNIAFRAVAQSSPDGYTILISPPAIVVNPSMARSVPYNVDELAPITLVGKAPLILTVHPSLPVRSLVDVVRLAKAKPGQLKYSSGGIGSASHLTMAALRTMAAIDIMHVPYKGAPQAVVDVINGQVEMSCVAFPSALPQIAAGRLRAVAQTGRERSSAAPDVPSFHEAGIQGYDVTTWYVFFGPAGIPAATVNKLNAEILKALKLADVQEQLRAAGVTEIIGSTAPDASRFVQTEYARWARILKSSTANTD